MYLPTRLVSYIQYEYHTYFTITCIPHTSRRNSFPGVVSCQAVSSNEQALSDDAHNSFLFLFFRHHLAASGLLKEVRPDVRIRLRLFIDSIALLTNQTRP